MKEFICNVAQNGFFAGPIFLVKKEEKISDEKINNVDEEVKKFNDAKKAFNDELENNKSSSKNAEIQSTVKSILSDEAFSSQVIKNIKENSLSAQLAVNKAADALVEEMSKVDLEYIRSRQDDIRGVANKLISFLQGNTSIINELSAICSMELSPAQLSGINETFVGALLTDKGSANSHVAILAGNINIPYLFGNKDAINAAQDASFIIIDSETKKVILDPDKKTKEKALEKMSQIIKQNKEIADKNIVEDIPQCKSKVYANIAGPKDIDELVKSGADGVGLFRTEFLFLDREKAPTEEEQFNAYKSVLEAMKGKDVIIRTMDIGSDKKVSWLPLPQEFNPALGLRGVRVSLAYDDLFRTQLKALLRAGVYGNLKVMFPMIASTWEVDEIINRINKIAEELEKEKIPYKMPKLGVMVETPAAAVCADELAKKVSFFSIGTNDLTQYTLAIDRESQGLDQYFNAHHEAIFRLIGMICKEAHKCNVEVGVCGQLAADSEGAGRLIRLGVDELSVPVRKVSATKALAFKEEELIEKEKLEEEQAKYPSVSAVADGKLIPMQEIPDPVFSEGTMGDCFGILPNDGKIYAPVSGKIISIAETGHAITIESDNGLNILIHAGIDTVKLEGKPFKHFVKCGDHVDENQLLMEADLKMITDAGLSTIIIVILLANNLMSRSRLGLQRSDE